MRISEVMTKGVECVSPHAGLGEVARKMRDLDVGSLPVCGDNEKLVGMLTDRDIVIRAVAEGKDAGSAKVEEVMTPKVIYCFEDEEVDEACRKMREHQIRRILVLNRDKRLVGIVSLGDLAVEGGDESLSGRTLEGVSEGIQTHHH